MRRLMTTMLLAVVLLGFSLAASNSVYAAWWWWGPTTSTTVPQSLTTSTTVGAATTTSTLKGITTTTTTARPITTTTTARPVTPPTDTVGAGYLSVKDFGAKGDGVSDDSAAIQSAINAAASQKKTVYLPAGTYVVDRMLTASYSSLSIQGAGRDVTTILMHAKSSATYIIMAANVSGWSLSDLTFKCPTGFPNNVRAVIATGMQDSSIKRVRIDTCDYGIKLGSGASASGWVIDDIQSRNVGDLSLYLANVSHSAFSNLDLQQRMDTGKGMPLYIEKDSHYDTFTNVRLVGGSRNCLQLWNDAGSTPYSDHLTFTDIVLDNRGGPKYPIAIDSEFSDILFKNITIHGNTSGNPCIVWYGGTRVVFDGIVASGGNQLQQLFGGRVIESAIMNGTYQGSALGSVSGVTVSNVTLGGSTPTTVPASTTTTAPATTTTTVRPTTTTTVPATTTTTVRPTTSTTAPASTTTTTSVGMTNYLSVKDYGAKGDGVTDDSGAIQACIHAAAKADKNIYLPAGTYYLGGGLWFPTADPAYYNMTVSGAGIGQTILLAPNLSAEDYMISANQAKGLTFQDMTLRTPSNGGNSTYISGFAMTGCTDCTIRRVRLENLETCFKLGSSSYQGSGWTMEDVTGVGITRKGLHIATVNDSTFTRCYFQLGYKVNGEGLYLEYGNRLTFNDCTFIGGESNCIQLNNYHTPPQTTSDITFNNLTVDRRDTSTKYCIALGTSQVGPDVANAAWQNITFNGVTAYGPTGGGWVIAWGNGTGVKMYNLKASGGEYLIANYGSVVGAGCEVQGNYSGSSIGSPPQGLKVNVTTSR